MSKYRVEWLSGNLKGIVHVIDAAIGWSAGDVVEPYGCSGSYKVLEVLG